jgi:acetyl esterase
VTEGPSAEQADDETAADLGLHPQIQVVVDGDPGDAEPSDLLALRAAYAAIADHLGGIPPAVASVGDDLVDGVPARIYRPLPEADGPAGVVVYTHGGGWQLGDLDGFDRVARALCAATGHHVVSVDYRLAPEHPFPAARDDVLRVVDWAGGAGAAAYGWDGARVVVAGDSAGAQLAVVAARARPGAVRAQVLAYPALDATLGGASYARFAGGPMLTRAVMARLWREYCGDADPRHPDLSPLLAAEHAGTPPTFIVLASHDVLRDDGLAYAQALREAGVHVQVRDCDGMVHGFLRWAGAVDEAGESLAAMGAFAARELARK